MPSQEEHLDQLLKGIAADGSDGQESMSDLGDLFGMDDMPDIESLLDMSELADIENLLNLNAAGAVPNAEAAPNKEPAPDKEIAPDTGSAPVLEAAWTVEEPVEFEEPAAMSEEEIEQILQANREEASRADDAYAPEEDLMSLLADTSSQDSDLQDIQDMLQKSDNNETVDDGAMDGGAAAYGQEPEEELSERQKKALEKKRLKEEKAAAKKAAKEAKKAAKQSKKEAEPVPDKGGAGSQDMSAMDDLLSLDGEADIQNAGIRELEADEPVGEKKKGLFARILDFLTEEDEEEADGGKGTEDIPLSDENKNILEEMDKEGAGKKGKKGKKPKKDKKGKNAKKPGDAENEDAEGEEAEGGKKPKKAKKAPKEKAPKETTEESGSRISLKRIAPVAAACVMVLLAILLLVNLGGDFTIKRNARRAFYEEDYETCYRGLYGKTLNESEQVMLGKSECILRIRLWMREYELFIGEGAQTEALDVLIQAVNEYAALYEYAAQWNADGDVSIIYGQILGILQERYGLTEAQALAIAVEPDDVEYTKLVTAAAEGRGYAPDNGVTSPEPVSLPDMLPEEQQFKENNGG